MEENDNKELQSELDEMDNCITWINGLIDQLLSQKQQLLLKKLELLQKRKGLNPELETEEVSVVVFWYTLDP